MPVYATSATSFALTNARRGPRRVRCVLQRSALDPTEWPTLNLERAVIETRATRPIQKVFCFRTASKSAPMSPRSRRLRIADDHESWRKLTCTLPVLAAPAW